MNLLQVWVQREQAWKMSVFTLRTVARMSPVLIIGPFSLSVLQDKFFVDLVSFSPSVQLLEGTPKGASALPELTFYSTCKVVGEYPNRQSAWGLPLQPQKPARRHVPAPPPASLMATGADDKTGTVPQLVSLFQVCRYEIKKHFHSLTSLI